MLKVNIVSMLPASSVKGEVTRDGERQRVEESNGAYMNGRLQRPLLEHLYQRTLAQKDTNTTFEKDD